MFTITGAEITFGFRALKAALGVAREVKDLTDTTAIKTTVIELQGLILDAQSNAIEARDAYASQASNIAELEVQILKWRTGMLNGTAMKL